MSKTRNITLKVDEETLRMARVLAARRGTSISRMLADTIGEIARREEGIDASTRNLLQWLDEDPSYSLGEGFSRQDLYDRPSLRRQ